MDLRRVDLNLLTTLDVLLRETNVTTAAARLGLSQPAVSTRLARLRELFGDRLFTATRRGLAPTPRARELALPLARLLDELGALLDRQAFDPASANRRFTVAAPDAVHATVTAPLALALQRTAPGLDIAMLAAEGELLERRLLSGEIDLLLLTPALMPAAALAQPLYDDPFMAVVRPGHPALTPAHPPALPEVFDLDTFCTLEHVLVSTLGGGFRGAVDEALARLGRSRRVRSSVPSFLLVPELVERSDLVATVPARVAGLWADRLARFSPPLALPPSTVSMGWSARASGDPGLAWLRARCVEQAAAPPLS